MSQPALKHYTPWHRLFFYTLEKLLPRTEPRGIFSEYQLSVESQRADVLLLLQEAWRGVTILPSLVENLGQRTLVELKGPTDDLAGEDCPTQIGYACQYEVKERLDGPGDVRVMIVASRLTRSFHQRIQKHRGRFALLEPGVHRVEGLMYDMCCIEADLAWERPGNGLLYMFSRYFLKDPFGPLARLSGAERDLFMRLCQDIRQLKRSPEIMQMKDNQVFQKSTDELLHEFLASMSLEERLQGASPDKVLSLYRPEERLQGLRPEERLKGLTPEELADLLSLLQKKNGRG